MLVCSLKTLLLVYMIDWTVPKNSKISSWSPSLSTWSWSSQTWYLSNLLHKHIFLHLEIYPKKAHKSRKFYISHPQNLNNISIFSLVAHVLQYHCLTWLNITKNQKDTYINCSKSTSTKWNFTRLLIILHKRCLWCLWQISSLRCVYRGGFILCYLFIEKDLFILCLLFIEKDVYLVFATCAFPQRACVRASLDTSTNNWRKQHCIRAPIYLGCRKYFGDTWRSNKVNLGP